MASKAKRPTFTRAEYERAHAAYDEFKANGHTELKCLHCGLGHFHFVETRSSLEIRCDTSNCFIERVWGI